MLTQLTQQYAMSAYNNRRSVSACIVLSTLSLSCKTLALSRVSITAGCCQDITRICIYGVVCNGTRPLNTSKGSLDSILQRSSPY
jgi:hypothetical protein